MTPRRLLAIWVGVLGELCIITAETIDPIDDPDYLAIDEIINEVRRMVRR